MAARRILLKGTAYSYELTKSRRKSIAIQIKPDGTIQVRAPLWMPLREIEGYLGQKENWIVETVHRITVVQSMKEESRFEYGDRLFLMGKEYFLELKEETGRKRSNVKRTEESIILTVGKDADRKGKKEALEHWYREQARSILTEKAERFSQMLGVKYIGIRIKNQKSCWGSCSTKGNLNFNWHIILAPEAIVDYLVIHELCHLRHMNHSRDFWELVESLYPDYKNAKKWLKENGHTLRSW